MDTYASRLDPTLSLRNSATWSQKLVHAQPNFLSWFHRPPHGMLHMTCNSGAQAAFYGACTISFTCGFSASPLKFLSA